MCKVTANSMVKSHGAEVFEARIPPGSNLLPLAIAPCDLRVRRMAVITPSLVQRTHALASPLGAERVRGLLSPADPAIRYRHAAATVARQTVVAQRCVSVRRQRDISAEHRADLFVEAQSAIGEFIAARVCRFPRLASALLARFSAGTLPRASRRALHAAARLAIRRRAERLSGFVPTAPIRPLTVSEARNVRRQIDALLVQVRRMGGRSEYAGRAARAHAALLIAHRADALSTATCPQ